MMKLLENAIMIGDLGRVFELFQTDPDMINCKFSKGLTPYLLACQAGNVDIVEKMQSNPRVNLMARDDSNKTKYHLACEAGHVRVLSVLLENGVDDSINDQTVDGFTAFYICCQEGHYEAVKLLSNIPCCDTNKCDPGGKSPFSRACSRGFIEIVKYLCTLPQVDKRRKNLRDGDGPYMYAAGKGHVDILTVLDEFDLDDHSPSKNGTPLTMAMDCNKFSAAKHLMGKGMGGALHAALQSVPMRNDALLWLESLLQRGNSYQMAKPFADSIDALSSILRSKDIDIATAHRAHNLLVIAQRLESFNVLGAIENHDWERLLTFPSEVAAVVDCRGRFPLHLVIKLKAPNDVICGIFHKFPEAACQCDDERNTPLHLAAASNVFNPTVVCLLIDRFPDALRMKNKYGKLPIHEAAVALQAAQAAARLPTLFAAYPESAQVQDDATGRLLLHHLISSSASSPSIDMVQSVVAAYPDAISAVDGDGLTPLDHMSWFDFVNHDQVFWHIFVTNAAVGLSHIHKLLNVCAVVANSREENRRIVDGGSMSPILLKSLGLGLECVEYALRLIPIHAQRSPRVDIFNHAHLVEHYNIKEQLGMIASSPLFATEVVKSRERESDNVNVSALSSPQVSVADRVAEILNVIECKNMFRLSRERPWQIDPSIISGEDTMLDTVCKSTADALGKSVLHYAILHSSSSYLEVLAADPASASKQDHLGLLPLHCALRVGAPFDIVCALLDAHPLHGGASTRDKDNNLPLHSAVSTPSCTLNVVKAIFNAFPDAISVLNSRNMLPLHVAIIAKASANVILFLLEQYPDAAHTSFPPLRMPPTCPRGHNMCINPRCGRLDAVSFEKCVDWASCAKCHAIAHCELPHWLCEYCEKDKGCNVVFCLDCDRRSIKDLSRSAEELVHPLHVALKYLQSPDVALAILSAHPQSAVELGWKNRTPLHLVADSDHLIGFPSLLDDLLAKSPDGAKSLDVDGMTPLHLACQRKITNAPTAVAIDRILDAHPQAVTCLNTSDRRLPLHLAAIADCPLDIITKLVSTDRSTVHVRDKFGMSALDCVVAHNTRDEVLAFLIEESEGFVTPDGDGIPDILIILDFSFTDTSSNTCLSTGQGQDIAGISLLAVEVSTGRLLDEFHQHGQPSSQPTSATSTDDGVSTSIHNMNVREESAFKSLLAAVVQWLMRVTEKNVNKRIKFLVNGNSGLQIRLPRQLSRNGIAACPSPLDDLLQSWIDIKKLFAFTTLSIKNTVAAMLQHLNLTDDRSDGSAEDNCHRMSHVLRALIVRDNFSLKFLHSLTRRTATVGRDYKCCGDSPLFWMNSSTPSDQALFMLDYYEWKAFAAPRERASLVCQAISRSVKADIIEDLLLDVLRDGVVPIGDIVTSSGDSALHLACREGLLVVVQCLVSNGADVNRVNQTMNTPLYWAADKGFATVVQYLVDNGADVNYMPPSDEASARGKGAAIHAAAFRGHSAAVQVLVEAGADFNILSHTGQSALAMACAEGYFDVAKYLVGAKCALNQADNDQRTPLHAACQAGHVECVKCLVEGGADVNIEDSNDQSALEIALLEKQHLNIASILVTAGAKVKATLLTQACKRIDSALQCIDFLAGFVGVDKIDAKGSTAMCAASKYGVVCIVEYLICAGADLNLANRNHETPLYFACQEGRFQAAKVLVNAGADINMPGQFLRTAFSRACSKGHADIVKLLLSTGQVQIDKEDFENSPPLHFAVLKQHSDIVELIADSGADVNSNEFGNPFFLACEKDDIGIARYLAARGASVHQPDQSLRTPLMVASGNGNIEMVKWLVQRGGGNAVDEDGESALHYACHQGHSNVVAFLTNVVDVEVISLSGNTPMSFAVNAKNKEIIRILYEAGAVNSVALLLGKSDTVDDGLRCLEKMLSQAQTSKTENELAIGAAKIKFATLVCDRHVSSKLLEITTSVDIPRRVKVQSPVKAPESRIDIQSRALRLLDASNEFFQYDVFGAMQNCNWPVVSQLVNLGARVLDKDRKLPIHHLASQPMVPLNIVQAFLTEHPEGTKAEDKDKRLPLHFAALHCARSDVMSEIFGLHPLGANMKDKDAKLPLHHAANNAANMPLSSFEFLLSSCPEAAMVIDGDGKLPLHLACAACSSDSGGDKGDDADERPAGKFVLVPQAAGDSLRIVEMLLEAYPEATKIKDRHGKLPIEYSCSVPVFNALISAHPQALKFIDQMPSEKEREDVFLCEFSLEALSASSYHLWFLLVQAITGSRVPLKILHYVQLYPELAFANDVNGRQVMDLATPVNKKMIQSVFLWFKRYRVTETFPDHTSSTCLIFKAVDETDVDPVTLQPKRVALKLMRNKQQFLREVISRGTAVSGHSPSISATLSPEYVVEINHIHPNVDGRVDLEALPEYVEMDHITSLSTQLEVERLYCVVMPLADRNLWVSLKQERFAGRNLTLVKHVICQVLRAVDHLHSQGLVHADIKPLNIVRIASLWKLIDLDAACRAGIDYICSKFSSAYIPPEAIFIDPMTNMCIVCSPNNSPSSDFGDPVAPSLTEYPLLLAAPSFDLWSIGCVLYQMCNPDVIPLFQANQDDNLSADIRDEDNLFVLAQWTAETKEKKLAKVTDPRARNLIAQMLSKDPHIRPSITRVLAHPFLSGNAKVVRCVGEEAEFDVFLSYRVASDAAHVEELHKRLTAKGKKVWWDKVCLKPGEPWEEGFCAGLVNSKTFVCFVSRNAINHPTTPRQNFFQLKVDSNCDNVFLEYRLALELRSLKLIERVFPLLIGDIDPVSGEYSDFFGSQCAPVWQLPSTHVQAVESKLREHMESQALGTPIISDRTIRSVMDDVMACQGFAIKGDRDTAFEQACSKIASMIDDVDASKSFAITSHAPPQVASAPPQVSSAPPVIYMKKGCTHCAKVAIFLLDSGLRDKVKWEIDTEENVALIVGKLGKAIFPALQYAPGMFMLGRDDIIAKLAADNGIDLANLTAYNFVLNK